MAAPLPAETITAAATGLYRDGSPYSMGVVHFAGLDAECEYGAWLDEIIAEWRGEACLAKRVSDVGRREITDDATGILIGWIDETIVRALPVEAPAGDVLAARRFVERRAAA